ncbi:hypothetical protein CC2G_009981 [Coprinopsis cinerea AmutBmut pab1-1]|nr:hypothetical protein CC2G_009981 [Coprinopsis cinerea AmutBmut pab1-1]
MAASDERGAPRWRGWLVFSLFPSQRRDVAPTSVVPRSSTGPRLVELDEGVDSGILDQIASNPPLSKGRTDTCSSMRRVMSGCKKLSSLLNKQEEPNRLDTE